MTQPLEIVALEARNSLDFLREAFALYDSATLFAICRPETNLDDYPALRVTRRVQTGTGHGWGQVHYAPGGHDPQTPAQVVFSSGTEGKPKAILISAGALADVEERLTQVMGVTADIREYIGVPVTYSFGLGRARVVARAGGSFYLPQAFNPVEIRDMLATGQINAISAVPSLWRVLLAQPGFLGDLGARVRWIEIGSQYMSAAEKIALRQMFPNARIVQHYGLTEASRSTFLTIDGAAEDTLESVGQPIGQTQVKIGTEGEICIRGPHLAMGLLGEDGAVTPLTDAEGWLHTKDRGELRGALLYYGGRLDDQINLSGIKLASETLERKVAELVTVAQNHFAITSVADPLRGEVLLLAHDAEAAASAKLLEAALTQVLAARGIAATGQLRVLALETLPRTGSGKMQRKQLRVLWQEQDHPPATSADPAANAALTPAETRIAETWRTVLGPVPLNAASNFYDTGGDSLGAMQIGLAMEAAHFPRAAVRATLEGRPLGDIAALLDDSAPANDPPVETLPPRTIESWALNITRGFMVISVVMSHWMPGVWARLVPGMTIDPLAFISRMGTPGFACVFGIGVGYFMLNGYPDNMRSVRRRITLSFTLVAVAMVILAAIHLLFLMIDGDPITGTAIGEAFYTVLGYYALAILSLPLWLRLMNGRVWLVCALAIPGLWFGWLLAGQIIGNDKLSSPLEWVRLMLVAKYSYLHMTPMVLAGTMIGVWMLRIRDTHRFAREAALAGVLLVSLTTLNIYVQYGGRVLVDRDAAFWTGLDAWTFYVGFACLFLSASITGLHHWNQMGAAGRGVMKVLILLGGLALPIYAFHELVIPLKDILVLLGVNAKIALMITMGMFLAAIGYGMVRLRRMYFP